MQPVFFRRHGISPVPRQKPAVRKEFDRPAVPLDTQQLLSQAHIPETKCPVPTPRHEPVVADFLYAIDARRVPLQGQESRIGAYVPDAKFVVWIAERFRPRNHPLARNQLRALDCVARVLKHGERLSGRPVPDSERAVVGPREHPTVLENPRARDPPLMALEDGPWGRISGTPHTEVVTAEPHHSMIRKPLNIDV